MEQHSYKAAGVDRRSAEQIKRRIGELTSQNKQPQVLGGIGGFGALYELSNYREPVLVSSTDGVGTKLKIASMLEKYNVLGEDLVNACINDVVVSGASPIFFLDYISMGRLIPDIIEPCVEGMLKACEAANCVLIGGETAEMPGLYSEGDFDLAGFVVGVVEKSKIIDGTTIREGDVLVGIPSNGLHTNGFSLVRRVFNLDEQTSLLMEYYDELGQTLGDELLVPHRSYYPTVVAAFGLVKAMAHITGGGLIANIPRVLPKGLGARLNESTWNPHPIFSIIQQAGNINRDEMFQVFNMGLGFVMVSEPSRVHDILSVVKGARVVGDIVCQEGNSRVII